MLWESLVTDGHVRSARLRRLQPWLIALAIILVHLGVSLTRTAPLVEPNASVSSILRERVESAQNKANTAFIGLAPPRLDPEDLAVLPPAREVAEVIDATLRSLNQTDALPEDVIKFIEMKPEALWEGDWGSERVNYVKVGDMYLLAANLNLGNDSHRRPARWTGAFKKIDGAWQYTSIAVSGMYAPHQFPQVEPGAIPASLEPVLPQATPQ